MVLNLIFTGLLYTVSPFALEFSGISGMLFNAYPVRCYVAIFWVMVASGSVRRKSQKCSKNEN
jgi:hypothetical protein